MRLPEEDRNGLLKVGRGGVGRFAGVRGRGKGVFVEGWRGIRVDGSRE